MLKEIVIAIQSYIDAHNFILRHRLWKWILIPGIFYTVLFSFGLYFFWQSSDTAVTWLSNTIGLEAWLQKQRSEWLSFLFLMSGMMLRLLMVLFYFSLFKYVILIVGSPVFAYLSEKTFSLIEGRNTNPRFADVAKDAFRGIQLALRNALWQTVYLFSLMLLSLVPLVGWITPLVALFLECFYWGFSMMDYCLQRDKIPAAASIDFNTRHRGLAIGNGMIFYVMHIFLFIGWILAPAYAVVAGTLSQYKVRK